ncbi:MAG: T9SS type A sorting domain-containing protein, partial [Muribaculaceae bacterium]|nr:T9SS type A sorting domain-containing protein [Muribaculaceae bacterium]
SIKNVILSSTTSGASVGLFGALSGGEIINLGLTDANMAGVNNVGTLVGTAISGKIERCFATGKVTGNSICVGGLIGENIGATVSDCYAGVVVSNEDDYATGGIVGKNTGAVKNVYATGEISGKDYVGGIVGANYGSIRNSVALNTGVFGENDYAAPFGGNNNSQNQVSANHSWDRISRGPANWPMHGDHATDKKASELIDFTTFKTLTGWDFENVWEWRNEDGKPYPVLRNLSNQTNTIPASFFASSAVEEIFEADKVMITAGPNPFADYVTVICSEPLATVDVYSLAGGKMATVNGKGSMQLTVEMSGASDGMYIVSVVSQSGSKSVFKLIKK